MNKEQEELLDEAYEKWIKYSWNSRIYPNQNDKDIFINRIKTESNFSIHWGLKIEERELNDDELNIFNLLKQTFTKQITITYNDKSIESYE
jgi:CRISPR/Cas system CSM-associated protein Csm5 (group 7 of RAMP superfamily)